jgi:MFS family permease
MLAALKDVKPWLDCLILPAFGLGVAAFTLFTPTFIREFGFSPCKLHPFPIRIHLTDTTVPTVNTQLLTVIPYGAAFIAVPIICTISDRYAARAIPLLFCYAVSAAGFVLLLATTNNVARIAGTSLVAIGSNTGTVLAATWVTVTYPNFTKKSTVWALCQFVTQAYSILGTKIYDKPPRFFKGHGTLLGLQTLAAVLVVVKAYLMWKENKRRDQARDQALGNGASEQSAAVENGTEEVADEKHRDFRYLL